MKEEEEADVGAGFALSFVLLPSSFFRGTSSNTWRIASSTLGALRLPWSVISS